MNRLVSRLLLCGLLASPAVHAALPPARRRRTSARRPRWRAGLCLQAERGAQARAGGAVFLPAAFTQGCTIEAHNFAEATDEYKALGATVIGVSTDNIDTLNKFSVSECRGKFAVAADGDGKIMKSYDAVHDRRPEMAQRVSYVISPAGKVLYSYTDMSPEHHVANTLRAGKR